MERQRFLDVALDFLARLAGGDAATHIGHVSAPVVGRLFEHDRVPHLANPTGYFHPALSRMSFKVPGATSSFGWPGTVTWRGKRGCLNTRWFPRMRTCTQPSS